MTTSESAVERVQQAWAATRKNQWKVQEYELSPYIDVVEPLGDDEDFEIAENLDKETAEFLVAAHHDWPAVVAEVERLSAIVDKVENLRRSIERSIELDRIVTEEWVARQLYLILND